MKIEIVPTTSAHIRALNANLREEDKHEIEIYGFPTNKALWRSFKGSILRRTALIDGEVAAVWGCGGVPMSGQGQPWLMTSNAVDKVSPLRFVRIYQNEVYRMLAVFPRLVNWVDMSYDKAIRLLEIIGFKIGEPEPLGLNGALYCKFSMEKLWA